MADLEVIPTADAPPDLLLAIHRLLVAAFAEEGDDGAFGDDDWFHTLGGQHVVVREGDRVVAHAAVVERELEVAGRPFRTGSLEGVATVPGRHGEGLGSLAVERATELVRAGFELGELSTGRPTFYERLGWERWQGPTSARHAGVEVRTEEDDDGILVLRFGPSEGLDLAAPISCEGRSGDDW